MRTHVGAFAATLATFAPTVLPIAEISAKYLILSMEKKFRPRKTVYSRIISTCKGSRHSNELATTVCVISAIVRCIIWLGCKLKIIGCLREAKQKF